VKSDEENPRQVGENFESKDAPKIPDNLSGIFGGKTQKIAAAYKAKLGAIKRIARKPAKDAEENSCQIGRNLAGPGGCGKL